MANSHDIDARISMAATFEALLASAELTTLVVLMAIGAVVVGYALRTGVPPMPSSPGARALVLRLLPDTVDGTIYEFGSGWGGLAFALARRYPDNPVVGIELSPLPWLFAQISLLLRPHPNLSFRRADMTTVPLHDAGAVTCYLMPGAMQRLRPKLEAELRAGAVVASCSFAIDDWTPDAAVMDATSGPLPVYRYVAASPVNRAPGASSPAGTARSPGT